MSQEESDVPITHLLEQWSQGDEDALAQLMPAVDAELHRLAARFMRRERVGHTLGVGDLVNEAFLLLVRERERNFANRLHFFAVASLIMKNFLKQYARAYKSQKRGGGVMRITLGQDDMLAESQTVQRIDSLIEALEHLATINSRAARSLELFYYAGLSVEEIAELFAMGTATVKRDMRFARTWLKRWFYGAELGPAADCSLVCGT